MHKQPEAKFATTQELKEAVDSQLTYLYEAVSLYELNLGSDHPETADAYTKMGLALKENIDG